MTKPLVWEMNTRIIQIKRKQKHRKGWCGSPSDPHQSQTKKMKPKSQETWSKCTSSVTINIRIECSLDGREGHFGERSHAVDPGVVDDDINAPKVAEHGGRYRAHAVVRKDIELLADNAGLVLEVGHGGEGAAGGDHPALLGGEGLGQGVADPALAAAGDEDDGTVATASSASGVHCDRRRSFPVNRARLGLSVWEDEREWRTEGGLGVEADIYIEEKLAPVAFGFWLDRLNSRLSDSISSDFFFRSS